MGWKLRDDTIFSPSGDIWFGPSHFNDWSPTKMKEIIGNQGKRIEAAKHKNWESFSKEHYQLCEIISKIEIK